MANISLSIDGLTTGNPEAVSDLMNVVNDPTKFDNVKPVEETDFDFEQTVNDTFDEIEGEEVQESDDELEDVVDPRKNRANPDEDEDEEILLEDDPSKEENNLETDLDKMEKEAQVAMGEVDRMFNESVNQLPEPDGIYDSSLILKAYEMDKRPHDEWSDKFAIYTITPDHKDIADMKYIDKKDVYTYQPKENEYALDMSRDSGNIVYDYDFVPMGEIVDRWNRWREPINESYNIIESLKKDYESGKLSIDEIAEELYKAGHFNYIPDKDEVCEKLGIEELDEDTVKRGSSWVNKGKEGTHGKFKTKKAADAQRKAMFANGYKAESVNESTRIKQQKELLNEAKLVDDDFDDEVRVFFVKEPNPYTEKDEVLAVFPDIIETSDGFVRCYAHLGQHSNCDLDYVRKLEPATEEEYESLLRELKTNAKYDNLVVISPNDVLLKESADFNDEDDTDSFEYLYSLLVNGNISLYKARLMRMNRDEIREYQDWAREMGINQKLLKLQYANANEKDAGMRSFANEDDEDDTDTFEYVWSSLVNGNMTQYHNQLKRMSKYELRQYIDWAEEQGIPYEDLQLEFMYETLNPDLQYHSREGHMVKNGTTKPCQPQRTIKTINSNGKEVTGFTPKQDEIMRDKVVTIVENFEKVIKQSDEKLYPALQRRLTDKLLNEGVTTKVITKIIENLF